MPSILESAKATTVQAELDAVAQHKLRVEVDLTGRVEGSLNTTWKKLTLTAYVKALWRGPQQSVGGGLRVERDF